MTQEGPKHPVTGVAMKRCPHCNRFSGLTGIDGGPCIVCAIKGAPRA